MDRNNKMLIDASHPEETRVVVLRNGRVEEFDFESAARKLLRGNIYLAKVTRVEPSLQAAFVDYGGNRHGFLAFNEIHPDYYQIPVADREALKQEQAEADAAEEAEVEERQQRRGRRDRNRDRDQPRRNGGDAQPGETLRSDDHFEGGSDRMPEPASEGEPRAVADEQPAPLRSEGVPTSEGQTAPASHAMPAAHDAAYGSAADDRLTAEPGNSATYEDRDKHRADDRGDDYRDAPNITDVPEPIGNVEDQGVIEINGGNGDAETVEEVTSEEDALEELPERPRRRSRRQYKIQEVIKRRQIILIQVVKEERGNKGAALTTYISLAGRYTVLMPNTGRGGGISRKITQPQDRKRLKAIAEELDVAEGMGLIIRTAGAARTKQEIKRDYEYLLRLWESVRDMTLSSTAPCLVYEEGNLIKRSIRDLYSKDIDGVVVSGEVAHREARDFMTMLMPGHGDQVQRYDGSEPLFTRYGIERQLNALFSPYVNLRSGGYLVINQTEALVAVDVNSGKSTREFSIEETALNTNMEAAEEIARQLKLRDLAGLIVVDFIDMEEKRNNRSVERRLKDSLRHDRARIQVGRISHFGLMEMSRQRLRTGMLEGSTSQCPHCQGTGIIRSVESVALAVLRGLEDNLLKQPSSLAAVTTAEVALYILNHKRNFINDMEQRHGITITIDANERMQGANFAIERTATVAAPIKSEARAAVSMDWGFDEEDPGEAGHVHQVVDRDHGHDDDGHGHEPRAERHGRAERPHDDRGSDERAHEERSDAGARGEGGDGEGSRSSRRRRRRRGRRGQEGGGERHGHGEGGHRNGRDRHPDGDRLAATSEHGDARPHEGEDLPARERPHDDRPEVAGGPDDRVGREWSGRDAEQDEDIEEVGGDAGAEPGARGPGQEGPGGDERGDRQRRGRRRGRRGGRGRGREGQQGPRSDALGMATVGSGSEGRDWGIAEIARPGADQPDGPPAIVASSWDGGFVPTAPVPAPIPVRSPVTRELYVEGMPATSPPVEAQSAPALVVAEPVSLVSRVPIIENRPPVTSEPEVKAAAAVQEPKPEPASVPVPVAVAAAVAETPQGIVQSSAPVPADDPARPVRKGWWQRKFGGE